MTFILGVRLQDLGLPLTDFVENLRVYIDVYRVDPEIMQRHIFDFRFRVGIFPKTRL